MLIEYHSGNIIARLNKKTKILVSDVSFTIDKGKSLALVGETGSGKTIIADSIMRLLPENVIAENPSFLFNGTKLTDRQIKKEYLGKRILYIPQNGLENLSPMKKVKYHLYDSLKKNKVRRKDRNALSLKYLSLVGFSIPEEIMEKYPFELSGGMAQRVVIAIGLCSKPEFILLDEPTNGLEYDKKLALISLIDELFMDAAKLYITHDFSLVKLCDDMLVLCGGKEMEKGSTKEVLLHPSSPYTQSLLSSLVKNGMKETSVLRKENSSCPFYSRCPQIKKECDVKGVCLK